MATDDAIEISMRCVICIAVKRCWQSYRMATVPFWPIELWYDISKGAWAPPVRGKGLSRHSVFRGLTNFRQPLMRNRWAQRRGSGHGVWMMTNTQLYLAIGLQMLAVVTSLVIAQK